MTHRTDILEQLGFDLDRGPNGDRWGSAMGALGEIAHALEHYGRDYVPAAWGYRDSMICHGLERHSSGEDDQARTVAAYIARSPEREREIVRAGNVLDRWIGCLDRAGLSY